MASLTYGYDDHDHDHDDQINIYLYLQLSRWLRRRQKRCLRWDLIVELMKTNIYKKNIFPKRKMMITWVELLKTNQTKQFRWERVRLQSSHAGGAASSSSSTSKGPYINCHHGHSESSWSSKSWSISPPWGSNQMFRLLAGSPTPSLHWRLPGGRTKEVHIEHRSREKGV